MSNMFVVRMQVAIKGFYKGININMSIKNLLYLIVQGVVFKLLLG